MTIVLSFYVRTKGTIRMKKLIFSATPASFKSVL